MAEELAGRPKERHGGHRWSFDDLGLDAAEQRARFARYTQRFGVPEEVR
jgi:hypothetical protein